MTIFKFLHRKGEIKELAETEVNKVIKALYADNPDAHKTCDTQGNYTVYFDYSEKECIQFNFSDGEKNVQLARTYTGHYDVLKANGFFLEILYHFYNFVN